MALHGCLRCVKYVVFTLNFIVWLAGMGVLGLAIWMRMDPKVNHYVRAAYEHTEISTYYIICYILMAAGGVMTFVGFLGCCGAFQESKCMLGSFFCFLFLIFGAEVAGGVWAFIHRGEIEKSVSETFKGFLLSDYGLRKDPLVDEAINFVQMNLRCCGGKGPSDWHSSTWVQQDILDQQRVPDSCCRNRQHPKRTTSSSSSSSSSAAAAVSSSTRGVCGVAGDWKDGKHPGVWKQGCGRALIDKFKGNLFILVIVGLGIAAIQLLGMFFSITLCCAMRRSRGGGYKS